jgi:cytochrome c5
MKLKIVGLVAVCVSAVFFATSCKKAKVAFEHASMKPWFDTYCASCHASGKSNATAWLYDPADFNGSIKTHISHIYQEVYIKKSMPPSGMSQTELTKFNDWYTAGYSAK